MASSSIHLVLFLIFAAVGCSSAFNVTKVLGPLSQFGTFSNYLAQVGVVGMMADLNNVTILAVDNANMGRIAGKSREEIKRVMTMHVIPEYYDLDRLRSLPNGTALIRTVYVLTGLARGKDGMLLVTKRGKGGRLSFASAVLPQSKPIVTLLRSVVVPSRNISIFHVSGVIATPPPVVSVASEGADFDSAGGVAVSSKLMVRREFPKEAAVKAGIKASDLNEVFMPKTFKQEDYEDLKTWEKAEEKAPAKAPSKSPSKSSAAPKKSPAKAPSPSKSSNSTGGKKGKSPASGPSPSSDSPAPAPSKKKSDGPSPAPAKDASSKSPAGSKSPKAAKSSEPSPADSSSGDAPAPSKSGKGGSSSSSDSPASGSSPSPSDASSSKSSPPAPAAKSESPEAESPAADEAPAEAPAGGAAPMTVTNVGIMMTVMALWALAA